MKFLKLIGFGHLLLLAFAQFIFKYGFLDYQPGIVLSLNDTYYTLLVLATVCIAAGGFLMINITSFGSERFGISESAAYYIYAGFTIIGVGLGYYLSDYIGRPSFMMAFAIAAGTLYFYSTNLRESLLLGNIVIALLMGLSIMIIGIFALYPIPGVTLSFTEHSVMFRVITDYAVFTAVTGFLITLLNDLKKTDIDYNDGLNTLPILIGKKRTGKVVFAFGIIATGLIIYYINAYLKELLWSMGYVLLFILGPLVYLLINIWSAKTNKEYATLEILMKAVLFFTAISVLVITFNIRYNA